MPGRLCADIFSGCETRANGHNVTHVTYRPVVLRTSSQANQEGETKDKKMAADRAQNLQDAFLNHVRKNKVPLTIFLINGVKLQGVVSWFDNFCVLLRRDGHSQLVYKHAISTIMPNAPVHLMEGEPADTPTGA
jgi:host factor-I protein